MTKQEATEAMKNGTIASIIDDVCDALFGGAEEEDDNEKE